jgi:hypothetical protein
VYPVGGTPADPITVKTPIVFEFEYDNLKADTALTPCFHLYTAEGVLVLDAFPVAKSYWRGRPACAGRFQDRCLVPADLLNDGTYRATFFALTDDARIVFSISNVLEFDIRDIVESDGLFTGEWLGVIRPQLDWQTDLVGR